MLCKHLKEIEEEIIKQGYKETYRGKPWTNNCGEWVYFDLVLDIEKLKERFDLNPCVELHENLDPRSGTKRGLYCTKCQDAIMGKVSGGNVFPEHLK